MLYFHCMLWTQLYYQLYHKYMQEFNMAGDLSDGSEIADFQEVSLTKDGLAS